MKKKIFTLLLLLVLGLSVVSCTNDEKVNLLVPSGAPTLGIASALDNHADMIDYEVVLGSDALTAGFTNGDYDIIIAPVNLGAKFYNSLNNFDYTFYQTVVGGCFYLVSSNELTSINDIDNQEITVFGKNSTPDVIIRSLISYYNLNVTINYVDDVNAANASLVSGEATIIVSAQPSISKFNASGKFYTLDLQEEWAKMADSQYAVPQAGIFVKTSRKDNKSVKKVLSYLNESLSLSNTNPSSLAASAVKVDETLNKVGEETLTKAIPLCHFINTTYNKAEIEFYFNKLIELGLSGAVGGKLPDEDFYA